MTCPNFNEMMTDALDGRLSPADDARFQQLLAESEERRREWGAFQTMRKTLLTVGTESAPAGLADRIRGAVRAESASGAVDPIPTSRKDDVSEPTPSAWSHIHQMGWARAAAVVVLLGLVASILIEHNRDPAVSEPNPREEAEGYGHGEKTEAPAEARREAGGLADRRAESGRGRNLDNERSEADEDKILEAKKFGEMHGVLESDGSEIGSDGRADRKLKQFFQRLAAIETTVEKKLELRAEAGRDASGSTVDKAMILLSKNLDRFTDAELGSRGIQGFAQFMDRRVEATYFGGEGLSLRSLQGKVEQQQDQPAPSPAPPPGAAASGRRVGGRGAGRVDPPAADKVVGKPATHGEPANAPNRRPQAPGVSNGPGGGPSSKKPKSVAAPVGGGGGGETAQAERRRHGRSGADDGNRGSRNKAEGDNQKPGRPARGGQNGSVTKGGGAKARRPGGARGRGGRGFGQPASTRPPRKPTPTGAAKSPGEVAREGGHAAWRSEPEAPRRDFYSAFGKDAGARVRKVLKEWPYRQLPVENAFDAADGASGEKKPAPKARPDRGPPSLGPPERQANKDRINRGLMGEKAKDAARESGYAIFEVTATAAEINRLVGALESETGLSLRVLGRSHLAPRPSAPRPRVVGDPAAPEPSSLAPTPGMRTLVLLVLDR
ncbi:MAG: hypothetical protein CL910_11360 [Deltaproteobacteria bacterium]|nr:hypothetical protein [Deltaproteobacteria bacterium]